MSTAMVDVRVMDDPYTNTENSGYSSTVFGFFRYIMGFENPSPREGPRVIDMTAADKDWILLDPI